MTPRELHLFERTRNARFLWKTSLGILAVGILAAWLVQFAGPFHAVMKADPHGKDLSWQEDTLSKFSDPEFVFPDAVDVLETLNEEEELPDDAAVRKAVDGSVLNKREKNLALLYWKSLDGEKPDPEIVSLSEAEPPVPYANYARGRILEYGGHLDQAVVFYEKEGKLPGGDEGRYAAITAYLDLHRLDEVRRLVADPAYADTVDNEILYDLAKAEEDWWKVFQLTFPSQYEHVRLPPLILALILGAIWLIFWVKATQVGELWRSRLSLCGAAVLMGALSTIPVVFLSEWQDSLFHWEDSRNLVAGVLDCVGGVGLREEGLKLLFFLPFVPLLLWRGDEMEMLMVAGCVGLGFAIEENIGYFHESASLDASGRFLTANFFHMALTGLIGLSFCRAFRHGIRGWSEFLGVFALMVLMHGLYDAFIMVPNLDLIGFLPSVIFIGICYRLFPELHALQESRREIISLSATLVWGMSAMVALSLCFASYESGFDAAMLGVMLDAISSGVIIYMFLRELGDVSG